HYPCAPSFGNASHILKFKTDGTSGLQIGAPGAKGPNSNDANDGINGTPEPFWPADMVVDPKTNYLYVADGYGNRRVLIVDAATGKYIATSARTAKIRSRVKTEEVLPQARLLVSRERNPAKAP